MPQLGCEAVPSPTIVSGFPFRDVRFECRFSRLLGTLRDHDEALQGLHRARGCAHAVRPTVEFGARKSRAPELSLQRLGTVRTNVMDLAPRLPVWVPRRAQQDLGADMTSAIHLGMRDHDMVPVARMQLQAVVGSVQAIHSEGIKDKPPPRGPGS